MTQKTSFPQEDRQLQLVSRGADPDSALSGRILVCSSHFINRLRGSEHLKAILHGFKAVYTVDEYSHTNESLLAACLEAGADTYLTFEVLGHNNARRRLFRLHGLRYWHLGLGNCNHYKSYQLDWSAYEDDTYVRQVTSEERLPAKSAERTFQPIERLLLVGQVAGDQSLQYAGRGFNSVDLVREARLVCPEAELRYRPHPRTIQKVLKKRFIADSIWYPDPYLSARPAVVEVSDPTERPLADDIAWADAVATITSTAGYEAVQLGKPCYYMGIPPIHEHGGGTLSFQALAHGKLKMFPEYGDRLRGVLNDIQLSPLATAKEFAHCENELQTELYGNRIPTPARPLNLHGHCLGGLGQFANEVEIREKVLIVGGGPSAWRVHDIDTSQYTVIAVNSAGGLVLPDVMFIMNPNAWKFPIIWDHLRGRHHLISDMLAANAGGYPYDYYTFPHNVPRHDDDFKPWNLTSPGGVACRAIELAASFEQVKVIHCVGMDYFNWYVHWYDVREAPNDEPFKPFGPKTKFANILIGRLSKRISFAHYGPTSIKMRQL